MTMFDAFLNQVVQISWIDSQTAHGWTNVEGEFTDVDLPLMTSYGILIGVGPESIVLVADFLRHSPESIDYNRAIRIPKGCIKSIRPMETVV